jgi:signal transduction histidine kinase
VDTRFDASMRRALRGAGLVTSAMVAAPTVLHGAIDPRRLVPWAFATLAFAACFWASARGPARGARALLLVAEVLCVAAMVLLLCDGFEGSLLVLVALQLGALVGWRAGVLLVAAQTALLAAAIAVHWAPRAALLLAPPYLGFQLLAFAVARLYAQQVRTNAELRAAKSAAEENSRLAERLRIARELHDVVGHRLTALRLHLEAAERTAEGAAREACRTANALAAEALGDVRAVVASLREDDRIDLATALRAIAADLPGPPRVHLVLPPSLACADAPRSLALLRCAQEIVTNAARHAGAENLWLEVVEEGGVIELAARDDGRGAEQPAPGSGLRGMRERVESAGGHVHWTTAPGAGFSLRARLPAGPS